MDITPETPWDGTPDVSSRVIVAISRLSTVLRAGMWDFATTENLNPTQAEILQLLRKRTQGVRLNWLATQPFFVIPGLATEKGQGFARLAWTAVLFVYLLSFRSKFQGTSEYLTASVLLAVHFAFAVGILAATFQSPQYCRPRQVLSVIVDQVLIAALLYFTDEVGAPFVLAPLFFTFGTGLRYSRGYAIFASTLSSGLTCAVLLFSKYWQQYSALRVGLVIASIYLPFYVFRLTDAVALALRTDPLTTLRNRTGFDELLNKACENLETAKLESAVILLDLDGFKKVNDEQGHDVGDLVLKHVGYWLGTELRHFGSAARFGGDEFAVVVENLEDLAQLETALTKFLERTAEVGKLFGSPLGASIGVSYFKPGSNPKASYMYKTADQLMYKAKRQGKNQFVTSVGCTFTEDGTLVTPTSSSDRAARVVEASLAAG